MSSTTDVLMQMMLGGQQPGMPAANLPDLLGSLAQRDARLAPLLQQLQTRLAAKQEALEAAEEDESVEHHPEIVDPPSSSGREQKLKKLARNMLAELQSLRSRNDMLAEALGACHLCWGEDQSCAYCSGEGRVGAFVIDPKVFESVVGPASQQIRPRLSVAPQTTHKGEAHHAGL